MAPPLEYQIMRALNMDYASARSLVLDARASLGMNTKQIWNEELKKECFRLFESVFGPLDSLTPPVTAGPPASSIQSPSRGEVPPVTKVYVDKEDADDVTEDMTEAEGSGDLSMFRCKY